MSLQMASLAAADWSAIRGGNTPGASNMSRPSPSLTHLAGRQTGREIQRTVDELPWHSTTVTVACSRAAVARGCAGYHRHKWRGRGDTRQHAECTKHKTSDCHSLSSGLNATCSCGGGIAKPDTLCTPYLPGECLVTHCIWQVRCIKDTEEGE